LHYFFFWVDSKLKVYSDCCIEGHYFGETGDFHNFSEIVACDYLVGGVLHNDEALGFDSVEVFLVYVEEWFLLERGGGGLLCQFLCLLFLQLYFVLYSDPHLSQFRPSGLLS
jgi:hypothetical protein